MGKMNFLSGIWPFKTKDETVLGYQPVKPIEITNPPKESGIHKLNSFDIFPQNESTETEKNSSYIDSLIKRLDGVEEDFNTRLLRLEKRLEILTVKNKEILGLLSDNFEDEDVDVESKFDKIDRKINTVEKVMDEKIKAVLQRNGELRRVNQDMSKKYDAILDILAEKQADKVDPLPNLFVGDVSLREVWRKHNGNKDALLYSIAYMLKKAIEEKGGKVR